MHMYMTKPRQAQNNNFVTPWQLSVVHGWSVPVLASISVIW